MFVINDGYSNFTDVEVSCCLDDSFLSIRRNEKRFNVNLRFDKKRD